MVLIYSLDGTNVYGSTDGEFEGAGSVLGVESCKIVFLGAFPIQLFRLLHCCRMYHLATFSTASQTDGQTMYHVRITLFHH